MTTTNPIPTLLSTQHTQSSLVVHNKGFQLRHMQVDNNFDQNHDQGESQCSEGYLLIKDVY